VPRRFSSRSTERPCVSPSRSARRSAGRPALGGGLSRRRRGSARHALVVPDTRPVVRLSPGPLGLLLALLVLVTGSGALGAVQDALTGGAVRSAALAVPRVAVKLPAGIEALSPYLEQDSCNPVATPGAVKLGDLLRATYPGTSYGIARGCGSDGIASEHYEGRAVDWFTSVRDPAGAARATSVLNWLLGADAAGRRYANARRLGVMYLIWNNRIWGSYRSAEGWRPYSNCAAHPEKSYDTTCHRDHIHISLSWAGAAGRTSFWTGSVAAVDYGPCRPAEFNWAPPYSGPRATPCPAHATVRAPRGAPSVAAGLFAASGARLAPGSTGPLVSSLQRALHLAADGSFGPVTATALSAFRTSHALPAGQVVDAPTWRALLKAFSNGTWVPPAPTPSPAPSPTPTPSPTPAAPGSAGPLAPYVKQVLTYGSTGPAVRAVQHLLAVTPVSGWYGPVTTAAVRKFQAAHKIPTTGNVGPLTWAALARLADGGGSW
jgi:peptidoglycan hydrolase-like protein with peptidoglycan-binding domain